MIIFRNLATGEEKSHVEFVSFIWEEAEKKFSVRYGYDKWCALNKEEQLEKYCEEYEYQLLENDWTMNEQ